VRFKDTRVLVTGATGFIGRVVTRKLVEEGAAVTALARPTSDTAFLRNLGVTIQEGNVRDPSTLDFRGQDVIVHAAAWVGMGLPKRKRALFWETNVDGTRHALDAARRGDVQRFVHVSSIAALGRTRNPLKPVTETDFARRPNRYASYYEESKTAAHALALDALREGLPVVAPMPGLVMGRGSPFDGILQRFAAGTLPALPSGDGVKGWVHVKDAAEGILLTALKGKGPYILVDDCVTVRELFARLTHLADVPKPKWRVPVTALGALAFLLEKSYHAVGKTPPLSRELVMSLREPMRYDASRARKELQWKPDMWTRLTEDVRALKPEPGTGKGKRKRK
jgi:nucleoside-diphosphate-sugar epimerase